MFYATSKAAVYSAAPVGINPDENIALLKQKTDLEEEWWKTPFNGMPSNPAKQFSKYMQ